MHSQESLDAFWAHMNHICQAEHAILSRRCTQVHFRVPSQVPFSLADSRASLGEAALGREIKGCLIDSFSDTIPAFGQEEWRKFIDGVFGHLTLSKVSQEMLDTLKPAQRKTLRQFDKPEEATKAVLPPEVVIQWLQEHMPAKL